MAKYDVINKETGEKKIIDVSVHDIQQWYQDNPEWQRDWSEGCAGNLGEFGGEWKSKLANKHSGWKHILDKVKNTPKSQAKDLY